MSLLHLEHFQNSLFNDTREGYMSAVVGSQEPPIVYKIQAMQVTEQALKEFQEQQPAWYEGRKYLYLKAENGSNCYLTLQTYSWLHALLFWLFEDTGINIIERPTPLKAVAFFCNVYNLQEPEKLKACYHKYLDKVVSHLQGPELVTYTQIKKVVSTICFFQPTHLSLEQMTAVTKQCGVTQEQYERLQAYIMEESTIKLGDKKQLMSCILQGMFDKEDFSHHKPTATKWRGYLYNFLLKARTEPLLKPFIEKVISRAAAKRLKETHNPEECLRSMLLPSSLHLPPFYLDLLNYIHERMPEIPRQELSILAQTDRKEFFKKALLAITRALHTQEVLRKGQQFMLELVDKDILDRQDQMNYNGLLKDFFTNGSVGEIGMSLMYTPELLEQRFFQKQLPEYTLEILILTLRQTFQLELGYALIEVLENQNMNERLQADYEQAHEKFLASIHRPQEHVQDVLE